MRTKIFLFQLLATALIGSGIAGIVLISPAYAQNKETAKSTTSTKVKTAVTEKTEAVKDSVTEKTTPKVEEAKVEAKGVWNSIKNFGISIYEKVDTWRAAQLEIWKAIKMEKETQIAVITEDQDAKRSGRVDKLLDGQQDTLFQGSGSEVKGTGSVFLLKLYSFVLFLFVIIFSSKVIFYGIAIFLILTIIARIINKFRHPQGY